MKLYDFWRSGAAYRVRIALNLKGLTAEHVPIHLSKDGGHHRKPEYLAINPQGRVPTLVADDGTRLMQSSAILEWLEETYPTPPILPQDPTLRAKVRAVAGMIGSDLHPLTNVGPLNYLRREFKADEAAVLAYIAHWNAQVLPAVESLIGNGPFAFGQAPTMADLYIVPQVYSARRFKVPLEAYPKITALAEHCATLDAFAAAAPEKQMDAE
jgi:maleylacetoacetate isomerase